MDEIEQKINYISTNNKYLNFFIIIQKKYKKYYYSKRIDIPKSNKHTKQWRQKQEWYTNGKKNECEIYQRNNVENITKKTPFVNSLVDKRNPLFTNIKSFKSCKSYQDAEDLLNKWISEEMSKSTKSTVTKPTVSKKID